MGLLRRSSATRVILLACLACAACDKSAPAPPTVTPPANAETITGTERLGWDQQAGDTTELAAIRYAIYVDGARSELIGVSCATTATSAGYACSVRLPPLTAGNHALEIASFVQDESLLESPRSATLHVVVTGATTASTMSTAPRAPDDAEVRPQARAQSGAATADMAAWPSNASRVVDGLDRPADLALLPDGRILIAERSGRVRVVQDGALVDEAALVVPGAQDAGAAVLALAVDPHFARTHFVFAIHTARSRSGARAFTLARFREAGNTLGDRILLLDEIPASADPHAALRFGPDGKLYAAFDDGGDEQSAADGASVNGKILRLNPDGTTPDDQPRHSPILSDGLHAPRGLDWHRRSARLWSADTLRVGSIPWTTPPASIAAQDEDLYIGSETGLLRARIDAGNPERLAGTSDVLRGVPVLAVLVRPDGTIVFATDRALGSLRAHPEQ